MSLRIRERRVIINGVVAFDLHLFHIVRARGKQRQSDVVERDCENEVHIKEWSTLGNNKSPAALYYYFTWNALHLHGRNHVHAFTLCCVSLLLCDDHIFGASIVRDLSVENMSYFDEIGYGDTKRIYNVSIL